MSNDVPNESESGRQDAADASSDAAATAMRPEHPGAGPPVPPDIREMTIGRGQADLYAGSEALDADESPADRLRERGIR